MSVIVYHDGVMAADTRAYSGNSHPVGNKMKIHRLKDGSLLGISSGQVGIPEEFKAWIERGASREDYGPPDLDLEAILVKPDGQVFLYNDSYYSAGPLLGRTFTIGSGKKYAHGAIIAGCNAVQAVEVAIVCDPFCGGPVSSIPLSDTAADEKPSGPIDLTGFSTDAQLSTDVAA